MAASFMIFLQRWGERINVLLAWKLFSEKLKQEIDKEENLSESLLFSPLQMYVNCYEIKDQ